MYSSSTNKEKNYSYSIFVHQIGILVRSHLFVYYCICSANLIKNHENVTNQRIIANRMTGNNRAIYFQDINI